MTDDTSSFGVAERRRIEVFDGKKGVQARLDPQTMSALAAVAKAQGLNESEVVRAAISAYLREAQRNAQKLRDRLRREFEENDNALNALQTLATGDAPELQPAAASGSSRRAAPRRATKEPATPTEAELRPPPVSASAPLVAATVDGGMEGAEPSP